jgi:lauroyl/myristoyl acyltransferase
MDEVAEINKGLSLLVENVWLWVKYFFFFPIFSLFPPPCPYLFSRYLSRLDYWYNSTQKRLVKKWMIRLLGDARFSKKELALAVRRYFEVIYCDQIDRFIYVLGRPKSFIRRLEIEGRENLNEALRNEGGIFLSAHFGGGFWILPFLRNLGIKAHFFSADIKRENYPYQTPLYLFDKLGKWVVGKASGERIFYKQDGRKSLFKALKEKEWLVVLFDVPPSLVKENMEVSFFGRRVWLPKGIISLASELNVPLLFFFSYLDAGKRRRICFEKSIYVKSEEDCVEKCAKLIEQKIMDRPDHWHLWPSAGQFFGK